MQKIAIIGASFGQKELCVKAKELGLYTICFAWEKGALCKEFVDKFYPISILEKDRVANICKKNHVVSEAVYPAIGSHVEAFHGANNAIGSIFLKFANRQDCDKNLSSLSQFIKVNLS